MRTVAQTRRRWIRWRVAKLLIFVACLVPLLSLAGRAAFGGLGTNPLETLTHATGDWTLRLLLASLTVTPLRQLTGWNQIIGFRRMLGLFAFTYGGLHLVTYLWFDQLFSWPDILRDVAKRPFITAGMAAFLLLVPLAATSTAGMIRRLGGRAWRRLHRLVYVAAGLGVVHYWWLVKADTTHPRRYALAFAVLILWRVAYAARRRLQSSSRAGRQAHA